MSRLLDDDEITRQLTQLPGWRRHAKTLTATYVHTDFPTAIRFVTEVADVAEEMDHHPDIDIRYTRTVWGLWTHVRGGVTQLDVELAHRIDAEARRAGATVQAG